MTVSIPTEWQRPEDIDEFARDAVGTIGPEDEQYFPFDGYEPPAEDVALILAMTKMSELAESEGGTWEGWEAQMEAWGITTEEDFFAIIGTDLYQGAEEITQTLALRHTIHGNEAIEGQFECRLEGMPLIINILMVFAEYDFGAVMLVGEEASVAEYEDVWETIRDSVQFSY